MFDDYRLRQNRKGKYLSDVLRYNSEAVVNATWMQSTAYRPVIVKHIDSGLPTFDEYDDEILDAHFEQKSKYDIKGDEVAYWLRFRPHATQEHPEIAIGSYVSIPDCDGNRETWLIVHIEDDGEQKWLQVLKCNWIYKWIHKGKLYQCLGCQRYASSYNSGVFWADRTISVENMNGFWLPTNSDSITIGYDQRFILSDGDREVPICWSVSKIETTIPIGLTKFTVAQVTFDPHHDNVELGIADYYDSELPISSEGTTDSVSNITINYSGTKPTIKVGGSEKTFTAGDNLSVNWTIVDGNNEYNTTNSNYIISTENNKLKLKVAQNYNLVGKVLTIKAQGSNNSMGEIKVEVVS